MIQRFSSFYWQNISCKLFSQRIFFLTDPGRFPLEFSFLIKHLFLERRSSMVALPSPSVNHSQSLSHSHLLTVTYSRSLTHSYSLTHSLNQQMTQQMTTLLQTVCSSLYTKRFFIFIKQCQLAKRCLLLNAARYCVAIKDLHILWTTTHHLSTFNVHLS